MTEVADIKVHPSTKYAEVVAETAEGRLETYNRQTDRAVFSLGRFS